jgi:hypothetical protein
LLLAIIQFIFLKLLQYNTTMNKFVFALLAILACASVGAYAHKCGTHNPPRGIVDATGRTTAACFSANPCDDPATRDTYVKTQSSASLKMRVNSIYFGDLTNNATNKENYDKNMEFFVNKYRDLLGIDVIINTTEVTSEYQTVGAEDNPTHLAMAQKYYKSGWMTAMYSNFDPNPELLLGYASKFPTELPASLADWYTIMGIHSLNAGGTTVHHEVGHMLGLYHVFIQDCADTACSEGVASENRNLVGDLCNDTLPMQNEPQCNGELSKPNDCVDTPILNTFTYADLPLNNYMAYTEDSCQTFGFTAQQSGRARCYLSTTVSFLNPDAVQTPTATPTATPSNTATPTATPGARVSSATQFAAVGLASLALALTL